tara:strand:- start:31 stop:414 length:384 start_codon:yes stop_codon:yes gene_type:complete
MGKYDNIHGYSDTGINDINRNQGYRVMKDQLDMIDSILPDVVFDQIAAGDIDVFLEALGADGLTGTGSYNHPLIEALRDAIACKQASHVGELVIEYVTSYYSRIAREEIAEDLEDYIDKYVNSELPL